MSNIFDNIYWIGNENNCIVNITSKTITFWWPPNEGNKNVYKCGLMDSNGDFIRGNMPETGKVRLMIKGSI